MDIAATLRRKVDELVCRVYGLTEAGAMGAGHATQQNLSEDELKRAIQNHLQAQNWQVTVAWGKKTGIDIIAARSGKTWIIEVKGLGSRPPMQNNFFVSVLGELLQRMDDPDAKYSIALPDVPKYRRLWNELPQVAKSRLRISVMYVDANAQIVEVS